jgi:endonuclease YncB( thermonuclease family)
MRLGRFIFGAVLAAFIGAGCVTSSNGPVPAGHSKTLTPSSGVDAHAARFVLCTTPARVTCVVDGDTFWLKGVKIRIADIDAPEISNPRCDRELELGEQARDRLLVLLNAGNFSMIADPREQDRFGRKLRVVVRSGASIGEQLVAERLASRWGQPRRNWCRGN